MLIIKALIEIKQKSSSNADYCLVKFFALSTDKTDMSKTKVLLSFHDQRFAQSLKQQFEAHGFECEVTQSGPDVVKKIKHWYPDFALIDLIMPEMNAMDVLQQLNTDGYMGPNKTRVIVTSVHSSLDNVRECIRLGAVDYLVKPLQFKDLLNRLSFHSRRIRVLGEMSPGKADTANLFLHLTELVLKQAMNPDSEHDLLLRLSQMVAVSIHAKRVSFIQCWPDKFRASVKASNDNPNLQDHLLNLDKYPEIMHCLNTQKMVVLDNLAADPTMSKIKDNFKDIQFNAMIVVPVFKGSQLWGVLSARMPHERDRLTDAEVRFVHIVASGAGIGISLLASPAKKQAA